MSDDDVVEGTEHLANRWAVLLYLLGRDDDNDAYQRGDISGEEIERRAYAESEERLKNGFDE